MAIRFAPRRAPIVALVGVLSLALASCASDDAGRMALAETTTLRAQMDQTRERQESQARDIAKMQSHLRGIETDSAERTREIRAAGAELTRARVLLEEAGAALREQQAATASAASAATAAPAYAIPAPPAPTTPSAPPMPIAPLPKPAAPEPRVAAVRPPATAPPASKEMKPAPAAKPEPKEAKLAPTAKSEPTVKAAAKPAAPAPKPATAAREPAPASARAGPSVDELFSTAMANFRAQEHGQAVLELTDLIARFPTHSLAPAAQLWIGEAYYQQRDYRQALVELKRVAEGYPKSPQVADALLKTGLCHRGLGDRSSAGAAWEQVVRDYPASAAAGQARNLLGTRESAARAPR